MNLIIHHPNAWKMACAKYQLQSVDTPQSWPVLISFNLSADEKVVTTVSVITADMAAKFLSSCPHERIIQIDPITRSALTSVLTSGQINNKPVPVSSQLMQATAVDVNTGEQISWTTSGPSSGLFIGQLITLNGKVCQVTATNTKVNSTIQIPTADPITGEEGMIEVKDEQSTIPGLQEIPMDPGKFDAKQKIADLGDPTEHVLDVERSI